MSYNCSSINRMHCILFNMSHLYFVFFQYERNRKLCYVRVDWVNVICFVVFIIILFEVSNFLFWRVSLFPVESTSRTSTGTPSSTSDDDTGSGEGAHYFICIIFHVSKQCIHEPWLYRSFWLRMKSMKIQYVNVNLVNEENSLSYG